MFKAGDIVEVEFNDGAALAAHTVTGVGDIEHGMVTYDLVDAAGELRWCYDYQVYRKVA